MQRAIEIARAGTGFVEPNPTVGAVIISKSGEWIAEGYHQRFGGDHAEVNAIRLAGARTQGAHLFVTLEPCSHFGKTPPCVDAVIAAGFDRVVIGCQDPAPHAAGRGIQRLREAGIQVETGLCETEARRLIAPFEMLMTHKRPWVHAKWAMTLDGRIASRTGHSQWISCEASRAWVHNLRGRVDAIMTGAGTVRADDPLLTARPPGPRTALRVIIDSTGESVVPQCRLLRTLDQAGVLVCVSAGCSPTTLSRLQKAGAEVFQTKAAERVDLTEVLAELGRRQLTHVLLEAGPRLLGNCFDLQLVDEIHAFIAPKIVGGATAPPAVGGAGLTQIPTPANLFSLRSVVVGEDVLIEADVRKTHHEA